MNSSTVKSQFQNVLCYFTEFIVVSTTCVSEREIKFGFGCFISNLYFSSDWSVLLEDTEMYKASIPLHSRNLKQNHWPIQLACIFGQQIVLDSQKHRSLQTNSIWIALAEKKYIGTVKGFENFTCSIITHKLTYIISITLRKCKTVRHTYDWNVSQ